MLRGAGRFLRTGARLLIVACLGTCLLSGCAQTPFARKAAPLLPSDPEKFSLTSGKTAKAGSPAPRSAKAKKSSTPADTVAAAFADEARDPVGPAAEQLAESDLAEKVLTLVSAQEEEDSSDESEDAAQPAITAPTEAEAQAAAAGSPIIGGEANGVTETGDAISPAVEPEADGVIETGNQISDAISPSAAGATDAAGNSTPAELPVPTWPLYGSPPKPSEEDPKITTKKGPDGTSTITMHMDNLDVRKALEVVSRRAGVNILVSPGVSGNVTVDLQDVTIEQALQAIVKLCNLQMRNEGDLIYISTADEVNQNANTQSGQMMLRTFRLNYAKGTDLVAMVKPLLTPRGRVTSTPAPEIGIKSDTTKAGGDSLAANDVLVVQDYPEVLDRVEQVVSDVDIQPAQVLIEAVILQVTLNNSEQLGINYAVLGDAGRALVLTGSGAAVNAGAGFMPASVLTATGALAGSPQSGFGVDEGGVKFGFVDRDVTGFIRAIEACGKVKVLATPRLLVLSRQRAEIQLGDRLGFRTLTQTQTSTIQKIEFMNVGTQLRLRPFVAPDGMVRMEIHPERSSGEVVDNVPSTHTTEVTTNVMVPDGATIVIGGLIDDENVLRYQGIPGLMNLPYIGCLFRLKTASHVKKELVVLLTPRIWRQEGPFPVNEHVHLPKEAVVARSKVPKAKSAVAAKPTPAKPVLAR